MSKQVLIAWSSALAFTGFLSLAGCSTFSSNPDSRTTGLHRGAPILYPTLAPADREAIARCLRDVKLDEGVCVRTVSGRRPHKVTVEEALAELGAKASEDGKVRDRTGKEIRFWRDPLAGRGTPYTSEEMNAVRAELEKLQKQYTVIVFDYYPGQEKGDPPPIVCSAAR